jgi:hypothetical protein
MRLRLVSIMVTAVLAACVAIPRAAAAEDVSVSAVVEPAVVAVGDQATLVVTIQGKFRKGDKPVLPALDDFSVFESGTSQSINFVNGAVTSSLIYTYMLVPRTEGMFTIAPITFKLKDKVYEANPVKIEVVAQAAQIPPPAPRPSGQADRQSSGEARPFFVKAAVNRDTVYVNQQVTWTLYFSIDVGANLFQSPTFVPPEAEGFWMEELPPIKKYYDDLGDRRYLVNELKRGYFPTAPGAYTIGPSQVTVTVDDGGVPSRNDLFSRSFRSFGFGKPVDLFTEERSVMVLPLPAKGKPAGFSGVVGRNISMRLAADKQVVQVGEPVNLVLEIGGEGNIKTVSAPSFENLKDFKVYQSGSSSNVYRNNYTVSGKKKYEYVLVPKKEGKHTIEQIRLHFFDPIAHAYKYAATAPLHLDVKPGTEGEGREIIFAGGSDIEILGSDINHIHPAAAVLAVAGGGLHRSAVYLALHAIPALAVIVSLGIERRRRRWRNDATRSRSERALGEAEKALRSARNRLKKGARGDVMPAVAAALTGYLANKMDVSAAGLTFGEIEEYLAGKRVEDEYRLEVRAILNACDAARYAQGSAAEEEAPGMVERTAKLLPLLEKRYLK